jgi:hypothetical protein
VTRVLKSWFFGGGPVTASVIGHIVRKPTIAIMRLLNTIIEVVDVTICLPFYAIVFPMMRWWDVRAAQQISLMNCPYCKSLMSTIKWSDLKPCGIRLRIMPGAKVIWERGRRGP